MGTAYEMRTVRLIDITLPSAIVHTFPGPRFGGDGIRDILQHEGGPLAAILLKPNTGQPSEHYARFAKDAALAGIDYIKEDEMQLDHPACPLLARVRDDTRCVTRCRADNGQARNVRTEYYCWQSTTTY